MWVGLWEHTNGGRAVLTVVGRLHFLFEYLPLVGLDVVLRVSQRWHYKVWLRLHGKDLFGKRLWKRPTSQEDLGKALPRCMLRLLVPFLRLCFAIIFGAVSFPRLRGLRLFLEFKVTLAALGFLPFFFSANTLAFCASE